MPEKIARELWGDDVPPQEERWWEDPNVNREQLMAGLARYALARDSRYDRLAADTHEIAENLSAAVHAVEELSKITVTRDEVLLPAEVHSLRRRSMFYSAIFALVAVIASCLFLVGEVVPRCFFVTGSHPALCNSIPGYEGNIREADERLQNQRELIQLIPDARQQAMDNGKQIAELREEIERLRRQQGG